ncbi:ADP-ribosyltransferase [Porphyromonas sp.]
MAKRQKAKAFSFQGFDAAHYKTTAAYTRAVNALFDKATSDIAEVAHKEDYDPNKPFDFDDYPKAKAQLQKTLKGLASKMQAVIETGSRRQWLFACHKNDEFIASIIDTTKLTKGRLQKMQDRNLDALQSFQARKVGGMSLADRVWKYTEQYKAQIELGLDVGLGEGRSAAQLSRDLRQNLQDPNRLFRRVRDKRGNLQLSKAAKAFHPGQGVYRSSYKNAMRLTRSEINMAYREADHLRWQQLDFVVGFEVHRSNHEPKCKCVLCERLVGKYPKWFKFKGWHPQCLCYATAILMDEDDFDKQELSDLKSALKGTEYRKLSAKNEVTELPDGFKDWVAENETKQANWASTPYFIKDNFVDGDLSKGLVYVKEEKPLTLLEKAAIRHANRTPEQVKAIRERWEIRRNVMSNADMLEGLVDRYKSDAPTLASLSAKTLEEIKSGALKGDEMKERLNLISRREKIKEAWDAGREVRNMADIFSNPKSDVVQYGIEAVREAYAEASAQIKKWDAIPLLSKRAAIINKDLENMRYNKANKAWQIVSDAYERHLDDTIDKLDIEEALSDAAYAIGYAKTSTDKKIKKLSSELDQIIDKPWAKSVIVEQKISELTEAVDRAVYVDRSMTSDNGRITPLSDEEAMSLISQFSRVGQKAADTALRPTTEKRWQELTERQRRVVTKYTETFNYLNERLRGIRYLGDRPQSEYNEDLPILTDVLANTRTTAPMVVRRGVNDYLDKSIGKYISELKPGDEIVDYGFMSTSTTPRGGFKAGYVFIIAVPAGAQGIYAEPFSHYTDSGRFSYKGEVWNGSSVEELRSEMEWIGQRGSRMRVISVVGNTIHLILTSQGAHL